MKYLNRVGQETDETETNSTGLPNSKTKNASFNQAAGPGMRSHLAYHFMSSGPVSAAFFAPCEFHLQIQKSSPTIGSHGLLEVALENDLRVREIGEATAAVVQNGSSGYDRSLRLGLRLQASSAASAFPQACWMP